MQRFLPLGIPNSISTPPVGQLILFFVSLLCAFCSTCTPPVQHHSTTPPPPLHRPCTTRLPPVHHLLTTPPQPVHHPYTTLAPQMQGACHKLNDTHGVGANLRGVKSLQFWVKNILLSSEWN